MRRGPFGNTNHPLGYWWLTLLIGQIITVSIGIALGAGANGGGNIIAILFDGVMLCLFPAKQRRGGED